MKQGSVADGLPLPRPFAFPPANAPGPREPLNDQEAGGEPPLFPNRLEPPFPAPKPPFRPFRPRFPPLRRLAQGARRGKRLRRGERPVAWRKRAFDRRYSSCSCRGVVPSKLPRYASSSTVGSAHSDPASVELASSSPSWWWSCSSSASPPPRPPLRRHCRWCRCMGREQVGPMRMMPKSERATSPSAT